MADIYKRFRRSRPEHSKTNAALLALPSFFAYPSNITWGQGFEAQFANVFAPIAASDPFETTWFIDGDVAVCVMSNNHTLLIICRGPEGTDWTAAFDGAWRAVHASWGKGVKINKAFYDALAPIYKDLLKFVQARKKGRQVFVAGHGFGGALATLCAFRLQSIGKVDVQAVYVWGSPRVGNAQWAKAFDKLLGDRCYRWVKAADFVARMPEKNVPGKRGQPYDHVGRQHVIAADGAILLNHDGLEQVDAASAVTDNSMRDYLTAMIQRLSGKNRLGPHDPRYLVRNDLGMTILPSPMSKSIKALISDAPGS